MIQRGVEYTLLQWAAVDAAAEQPAVAPRHVRPVVPPTGTWDMLPLAVGLARRQSTGGVRPLPTVPEVVSPGAPANLKAGRVFGIR